MLAWYKKLISKGGEERTQLYSFLVIRQNVAHYRKNVLQNENQLALDVE